MNIHYRALFTIFLYIEYKVYGGMSLGGLNLRYRVKMVKKTIFTYYVGITTLFQNR